MSFRLSDLLNNNNTSQTTQSDTSSDVSSVSDASSSSDAAGRARAAYLVNDLQQGQSISGMVKVVDGNKIVIDLGSQVELSARLDSEVILTAGQIVTFEVKSNLNNKLSLSPLFTNTSANISTILNALSAAEMPATTENVSMVSTMIQEGLSIDKGSLWNMSRLSASFSEYQPSSVAELTGMGLEVNEGNLQQLEAYHNMKYQILDVLTELSGEMDNTWQEFGEQSQSETGIRFMQNILGALSEGGISSEQENGMNATLPGQMGTAVNSAAVETIPQNTQNQENTNKTDKIITQQNTADPALQEKTVSVKEGIQVNNKILTAELINNINQSGSTDQLSEAVIKSKEIIDTEAKQPSTGTAPSDTDNAHTNELVKVLQSGRPEDLIGWLKNASQGEILKQLQSGVLKPELVVKVLTEALKEDYFTGAKGMEHYQDAGKAFQKLFTGLLREQWQIEPEDVANKSDVKELYQKLEQQSARLLQVMENFDKSASTAGKTVQQLNQNMEFLHAVNQVFPYIQLPLRASMNNAHGDLYVYMNRKENQSQDGSVSALLHLEMDNIGNLDIYVKLQNQNVQTHFYLQNDTMIDFISEHMDMLNDRLQKKGYSVQSEVTGRTEEQSGNQNQDDVISRMRGTGRNDKSLVAMTSFDVRA